MKIVFFTDTYEPQVNGVVTAIKLFKGELEKIGHEVFVVCPKTPGYKYDEKTFTLPSFTFKPYPEYRGALPSLRLLKWVKNINPDIIHVHTPATIGLMGIYVAKLLLKPVVATYHTLMEEYFKLYFLPKKKLGKKYLEKLSKKFIKKYTAFFYNKADIVTVPSTAIKKHLLANGVTKPIIVLPTGVDTDFFFPRGKKRENLVLWVGRLGKEKSLEVLLKAFKKVQEKNKKAKLILIGDGPERRNLEELAAELKINADFKGYLPREKLPFYYSSATVFVSPSTTETQGLTILESFSCACPVVVANSLGFKDFIKHGENGFFAKPKSTEDFAEKIGKIITNPKLRERLSKKAKETAKNFSISKQARKMENLYFKLIKSPLVSVIVPALNEEKYIANTLKSIKAQTYPRIEIIVVDNYSQDRTKEIAKKYADKVIIEKKRGVSRARNAGAKVAKGEILLFVDADTELEKRFVEKIVRVLKDKKTVCATGFVKAKGKLLYRIIYFVSSLAVMFLSFLRSPRFYGIVFACKKYAFEKVGGFNEAMKTCEDLELTKKLSKIGKCKFVANAIAFSSPRRLQKQGILYIVLFHLLNFFRYTLFEKPAEEYPPIR